MQPFWPVTLDIKVPWRDIDGAGHVNNAVYFSYMETARADAYLRLKDGNSMHDLDIILAHASCDYRTPASFGETLTITTTPTRVGNTSFALRYKLHEKTTQRLVAEGESIQVLFDYKTQKTKPITPELRAKLQAGIPETFE